MKMILDDHSNSCSGATAIMLQERLRHLRYASHTMLRRITPLVLLRTMLSVHDAIYRTFAIKGVV